MKKPVIVIKKHVRDYSGLVNLGGNVHAKLTSNPYFPSPTPSLATLLTAVTEVQDAIAVWGPVSNRGSHANLMDLRTKSLTLSQMLKSLSQYIELTAQTIAGNNYAMMANIIVTSGFGLKKDKAPQGLLQKVQNFRTVNAPGLNPNMVKLEWEKSLNVTSAGNIKFFKIFKSSQVTPFDASSVYATTTVTNFIFVNTESTAQTATFRIVPVSAAGDGEASDPITVSVLSI